MSIATVNKLQIFIIMFFMSLIMSVQSPLFTPYAATLGATSVLIGIMLSASQLANLTGNLIAGPLVDRFGKKFFIAFPMFISGVLFVLHGLASNSANLLLLRTLNGFTLAFLIPAALALLSSYAKNSRQQGKNMAIYGMLGTISSIIAPVIGGKLGDTLGYANTYFVIGAALIVTSFYTVGFLKDKQVTTSRNRGSSSLSLSSVISNPNLHIVFLAGFAVMFIHGVIIYEVPYLTVERGYTTTATGILFSIFAIGTLMSLSLFFINRFDPIKRIMLGLFGMCASLFAIFNDLVALPLLLFSIGFFFGILMPAMATAVTDSIPREGHGRAFGAMSAVYSLGMIISTFTTGIIRDVVSPYFIAFLVGMLIFTFIGYKKISLPQVVTTKVYE